MVYKPNEYEMGLFRSICNQIDSLYENSVAVELRDVLLRTTSTEQIDKHDVERLIKLLPLLQVHSDANEEPVKGDGEDFLQEWSEWELTTNTRCKNKILFLYRQLSNWLFLQYVVHQKQSMNLGTCRTRRVIDYVNSIEYKH